MGITTDDCDRNIHYFWEKAKRDWRTSDKKRSLKSVDEWLDMRNFLVDFPEGGVSIDERGRRTRVRREVPSNAGS